LTLDESFEDFLNGLMPPSLTETREEFAKANGTDVKDLSWAFSAGWAYHAMHMSGKSK
jgi:hypothetical protein